MTPEDEQVSLQVTDGESLCESSMAKGNPSDSAPGSLLRLIAIHTGDDLE